MWCSPLFPCLPFVPALLANPNKYRPAPCFLLEHPLQLFRKQPQLLCHRQSQKFLPENSRYLRFAEKAHRFGERITTRGISGQLKKLAIKYGIDSAVVYPHSFRHRFAKSFLDRCSDIAFLADLMGHESIETTRIYLRKTATEQRTLVDNIVDW